MEKAKILETARLLAFRGLMSGSDPIGLKSPVITGLFKDLSHSWQQNFIIQQ